MANSYYDEGADFEAWGYENVAALWVGGELPYPTEALKNCKTRSRFGQDSLLLEASDDRMTYSGDYLSFDRHPITKEPLAAYQNGQFDHYNDLSDGMVAYLATKEFVKLMGRFTPEQMSASDEDFMQYAKARALDPYFRQAIALAVNTQALPEQVRTACAAINVRLNEYLMQQTLAPVDDDRRISLAPTLKKDETVETLVRKNSVGQMTLAKTLFLMQFGGVHTMQGNGANAEYRGSMAEVLAHGGRTSILLGKGASGGDTLENKLFRDTRREPDPHDPAQTVTKDNGTAVFERSFATHGFKSTGKGTGAGVESYRESKGVTASDNYGLNLGVGGIGSLCGGKAVRHDGTDGHVYIKKTESTAERGGTLLVGFESEAPGETGRTGHKHDWKASPSRLSPFMSGKGGPGAKNGGRVVDLSLWKPVAVGALLDAFADKYGALQDLANGRDPMRDTEAVRQQRAAAAQKLNDVNALLAGDAMTPERLKSFMKDDLGIPSVRINGKDVSVEKLVDDQQKYSEKLFDRMNLHSRGGQAPTQPTTERERALAAIPYHPEKQYQQMCTVLNKAKDKLLGVIDLGDSDKMKAVKDALMNVSNLIEDPSANAFRAHHALTALRAATQAYINDPKKNQGNERMALVRRLDEQTHRQLQQLDEQTQRLLPGEPLPQAPQIGGLQAH